jgi:hypothetical protein
MILVLMSTAGGGLKAMKPGLGVSEIVEAEHRAIGHREDNQIALIGDGRVDQHVAVTFPTRRVKPIRRASTRPRVLIDLAARRYASL